MLYFARAKKLSVCQEKAARKLVPVAVQALLKELLVDKKAMYKYLSILGSEYSYKHFFADRLTSKCHQLPSSGL
jgi:hypothetical protein